MRRREEECRPCFTVLEETRLIPNFFFRQAGGATRGRNDKNKKVVSNKKVNKLGAKVGFCTEQISRKGWRSAGVLEDAGPPGDPAGWDSPGGIRLKHLVGGFDDWFSGVRGAFHSNAPRPPENQPPGNRGARAFSCL